MWHNYADNNNYVIINWLYEQVELLEGKNNEYEEQKESTEETLEQILEESEALQRKLDEEKACTQQAKYELHTAESRIAELEEENHNLLQLVSMGLRMTYLRRNVMCGN